MNYAPTFGKADSFDQVERNGETIWVHRTAPVWVVHYSAVEGSNSFHHEFWQPYIAIEPVKKGRQVWTHNNRRIGRESEFRTLDVALEAAAMAASQKEAA